MAQLQAQLNVANLKQTVNSVGPSVQHRKSQILKEYSQCSDVNAVNEGVQKAIRQINDLNAEVAQLNQRLSQAKQEAQV